MRLLNGKAAAAADKLADYEDEVRFLRAVHARKDQQQHQQHQQHSRDPSSSYRPGSPPDSSDGNGPERPHAVSSRLSSFSAFLPGRRSAGGGGSSGGSASLAVPPSPGLPDPERALPFLRRRERDALDAHPPPPAPRVSVTPQQPHPPDPSPSVSETLRREIENEKRLRRAAETSLNNAHKELEELTAQLFGQANEMVAAERRARAKLEDRVAVLEKRDLEKRRRLERLEKAVERIDRVKGLVG